MEQRTSMLVSGKGQATELQEGGIGSIENGDDFDFGPINCQTAPHKAPRSDSSESESSASQERSSSSAMALTVDFLPVFFASLLAMLLEGALVTLGQTAAVILQNFSEGDTSFPTSLLVGSAAVVGPLAMVTGALRKRVPRTRVRRRRSPGRVAATTGLRLGSLNGGNDRGNKTWVDTVGRASSSRG